MKKKDIIKIFNHLFSMKQEFTNYTKEASIKFKYGVSKILNQLKHEIELLMEIESENLKCISKYRGEEIKLFKEYGSFDENNNFSITKSENEEETKEKVKEFNEKLNKLKEYHKEELNVFEEKNQEYEEVDIILYKINIEYFPEWLDMTTLEVLTEFCS